MSHFDLLHPALQHHIVNSLGWRDLRPFQEAVIPRSLSGEHLIMLAPMPAGNRSRVSARPLPDALGGLKATEPTLSLPDQGSSQQSEHASTVMRPGR